MPDIPSGEPFETGKSYAVGFFDSEICYNALALFPSDNDPSWGNVTFYVDGCDQDNYVEIKVLNETNSILYSKRFTSNGRKSIDLSQIYAITSNENIKIRIEVTTYV